jgi:LysM repeat protein
MFASPSLNRMVATAAMVVLAIVIFLSVATPSPGAPRPRHYQVQAGDTLWSIAATRYSGSDIRAAIYDIRHANGLSTSTISVGQRLVLP